MKRSRILRRLYLLYKQWLILAVVRMMWQQVTISSHVFTEELKFF